MKSDKSKWKTLSIKSRLKKGFKLTTFVASASGIIAGIIMIIVSMIYSGALIFYGFSQGDIGKVMVTFSETRSATRALIGYKASDTLSKMSDTHDSKKETFQKSWGELQSSIKTGEEQAIYDDINSKLDSYWSLDDEIGQLGKNATDPETEGTEKVDNTVYIWYNVSIKYRRCFYDRTTAEIGAKSIHGNI